MPDLYDIVTQLTSANIPEADRLRMLNDFAYHFGWTPSDSLDVSTVSDFANAHLIVEHGLENTAVITFLRRRFSDLGIEERRRLLNISYNNLVDWHIQIEQEQILYVFNRTDPAKIVANYRLSRDELDSLRSQAFEQISGKRQSQNLPALDDALINTVSFWKRYLSSELGNVASNKELSSLFNAIMFVRAVEDNFRRLYTSSTGASLGSQALLEAAVITDTHNLTVRDIVYETLKRFDQEDVPQYLIDWDLLKRFDGLSAETVRALLKDFYRIKGAYPYEYDFSVMSKHALSRIYERYTSLLRIVESEQGFLFPPLPEEAPNKAYGSVYTPQFIARFFARYLREQMPPLAFKRLRSLEPAIGSGIFIRTLLELQCDPTQGDVTTELIETAFGNITGLDADPNASQAAMLSLSLLHLVLTNHLPPRLNIYTEEAIKYYQEHPELRNSLDAVISNPPFVSLIDQSPAMRERLSEFMEDDASGKIDLYLAFLKIGLETLKPGAYGLFVLPHNFLLREHARGMRKLISETCWIRCLVDLSAVRVFEGTDSYIILFIFQKRFDVEPAPLATIVKCQASVSRALQDVLQGRQAETKYYSIYNVEQSTFGEGEWVTLPPSESAIKRKLETLPTLDTFLEIRVGLQTGNNRVFIVPTSEVPKGERKIFAPFLPDREMMTYTVPEKTGSYVFYPFIDGRKIEDESELKESFPKTWKYLLTHEEKLRERPPVRDGKLLWWQPERPRSPQHMMRPKIVSPHLVVVPRFSLDRKGQYAIVRSPLMYPKEVLFENDLQEIGVEDDLLRYFVAVLNSNICYRYITEQSHRYGSGYAMLEPRTLARTPVPDPTQVSPELMQKLLTLVDVRLGASGESVIPIEVEIDELVTELYGLSKQERLLYGVSAS